MEKNIKHLNINEFCESKGLKMTPQRSIIAKVITDSKEHPDVETIYVRANKKNKKISLATVYRTVKLLEDACSADLRAEGFPSELIDQSQKKVGK